jgi:membrane-associated phospholipid phosphatase
MTTKRRSGARVYLCILVIVSFIVSSAQLFASSPIEMSGDMLQFILPATAAGLTLAYKDKEGGIQLGESILLSQGVTYGLKYGLNERRPNGGNYSMPSGHTSISFTAAEYMRKRYGWWYGVPAYAAASWVAYSRVESHNHWPKDVVAGAGIGIVSSYIFTRPYAGWKIEPQVSSTYWGLRLSRAW